MGIEQQQQQRCGLQPLDLDALGQLGGASMASARGGAHDADVEACRKGMHNDCSIGIGISIDSDEASDDGGT